MSSTWSGSIHREINDFDVISIYQYTQSMCGGPCTFAKCTFLSGKMLPQKTVNGILTSSTTCYIRHMCLFRSTLFPNKSTKYDFHCKHQQNTISSLRNPPWRQLLSCAKDVRVRSKMAAPIRPSRKLRFFIKITISQYHDIDISYIDIDTGKNAFSMTSLPYMSLERQ